MWYAIHAHKWYTIPISVPHTAYHVLPQYWTRRNNHVAPYPEPTPSRREIKRNCSTNCTGKGA
eukprot:430116-Rhodomonas_salina.3